jgi:general secretion pathway protein G
MRRVPALLTPSRHARRRAFTLVEILIVLVILGILASIVIPRFVESNQLTRESMMATTARYVRQMVQYHRQAADVDLSDAGYPAEIEAAWFRGSILPTHAWTDRPMIIDVESGGADDIYPGDKTFDPSVLGASNAWYNTTNGAFCVLVPNLASDDETLKAFNAANAAGAPNLGSTSN